MNLPVSDLRKGNLVQTEHGICRVHAIVWNDVVVIGKDGRKVWVKQIEGVGFKQNISALNGKQLLSKLSDWEDDYAKRRGIIGWREIEYIHQAQNLFYWLFNEELEITIKTLRL